MTQRRLLQAMAFVVSPVAVCAAQQQPLRSPSGRPVVICAGQPINDVVVFAEAPTVASLQRIPAIAAAARALHQTTRTELIRRFLLLSHGDHCSELRRAESERILRAQPFIADADVYAVPNDEGGVDIEVRTSDETSVVFGGSVRARAPNLTSLLVGNANLGGQGVYASLSWSDGAGFRDAVGARLIDHQFLGRPWILGLEAERASLGSSWKVDAAHPFLTDLQRIAWRARTEHARGYTELREPNGARPGILLERGLVDVGAIVRVGDPGRLNLFGFSVTGIDERTGDQLTLADTGVLREVGPAPDAYVPHRVMRLNALVGKRDITFVRVEGLDALTASQDLPVGFQVGALIGRSVPIFGVRDDDAIVAGDLYVGSTTGPSTIRLQLQGEARRSGGENKWDGVLTTGRLTHYLAFNARHHNQTSIDWSGGFRQRTPFQLLLGTPDGGIRGYEESTYAGGQRLVARTEERYTIGNALGAADVGFAAFADVGKQWAGDVPFGVTTPVKASLGVSLLAAVPPRSARVWRADLAFPLTGGANARWTLRFSNGDRTAFAFRIPRDVAQGREISVPSSIFAWP